MYCFANPDKDDLPLGSNAIDLLSLKRKDILLVCLQSLFNTESTPVIIPSTVSASAQM